MIEKLIAFISTFWQHLVFWVVVEQEQLAFARKWGRYAETLPPGFHWKCPVKTVIEREDGRLFPYQCDPQSLTTADDASVVVQLAFTVQVIDVQKYFANCLNGRSEIQDVACVELGRAIRGHTWAEVRDGKALQQVTRRLRAQAKAWGMQASDVEFVSCVRTRSIRLWQTQTTAAGQD